MPAGGYTRELKRLPVGVKNIRSGKELKEALGAVLTSRGQIFGQYLIDELKDYIENELYKELTFKAKREFDIAGFSLLSDRGVNLLEEAPVLANLGTCIFSGLTKPASVLLETRRTSHGEPGRWHYKIVYWDAEELDNNEVAHSTRMLNKDRAYKIVRWHQQYEEFGKTVDMTDEIHFRERRKAQYFYWRMIEGGAVSGLLGATGVAEGYEIARFTKENGGFIEIMVPDSEDVKGAAAVLPPSSDVINPTYILAKLGEEQVDSVRDKVKELNTKIRQGKLS